MGGPVSSGGRGGGETSSGFVTVGTQPGTSQVVGSTAHSMGGIARPGGKVVTRNESLSSVCW